MCYSMASCEPYAPALPSLPPTSSALNMTFPAITNPGRLVFLLSPSGRLAEEIESPPRRRTKRRGRHPHNALSPAFVRTAPPGHHIDGLYLYVQPTGARSWIQRLVIRGRRSELGLGPVAPVSLAEAREKAVANRNFAREGGDPLADKRRVQGIPTFAEATVTAGRSGLLLR